MSVSATTRPLMNTWISRKFAAICRRLSPPLRSDYELAEYVRARVLPISPDRPDEVRNCPLTMLGERGIDLDIPQQLARLNSWSSARHQSLFAELRNDPEIKLTSNSFFLTPDAEVYCSMILDRKPRRIIEVGSGFSTLVARKTIRHAGYPTRLVAIDPHPRTDVKAATDELILLPVEQSDLIHFDWSPEDILFIDSSHLCRTRGDLPYLYCQLLPSLPGGVLVHVHDIFLPYDYPNLYDNWCYDELYLLSCTLAHSARYHTVFANHLMTRTHREQMRAIFGSLVGSQEITHHFGCSFWFEVRS
jgi:hypothetical protein